MKALCGWMGLDRSATNPVEAMAAMATVGGQRGEASSALGEHWGLAAMAPTAPAPLWASEGIVVALVGRPNWRRPAWAEAAANRGNAGAAALAYREAGRGFLAEIGGEFALAIVDERAGQALLAIDRIGIQALCYARGGQALVFGTEANAVAGHPAIAANIDPQQVFNYLYCHMVPSPGTIFKGVRKLLPGQYVEYADRRVETGFYWQMDYSEEAMDEASRRARFHELLRASVGRSMGEEATGAFLSGGTDSSTVTGILAELTGRADTYSIGFDAQGFDEMEYARIAARRFKASTHEYYVTPADVADAIPRIAAAYDEPFGNASAVPTYYCARMASEQGKEVLLAGDGGDEIFGGNERYAKQKVFEAYWSLPGGLRKGLIEPMALKLPGADAVAPLRKMRSYIQQARVPLPDRLETYNFLERENLADILDADFLAAVDPQQPKQIAREVFERTNSGASVNRMMHLDLKQTLADNDLRKVNRMCALAGMQVRYPFLDDEMVGFSGHLPPRLKVRGFKLRHFFKESLRDFLPEQIIIKSKHGFGLPFGLWLKSEPRLMQLANDSLMSLKRRGYVRADYIDRILALHQGEHASYYGVIIWVMMMLEQWLESHRP